MKILSACDAKTRFDYLIDTAIEESTSVEKHGKPAVMALSIEDYERLVNTASDTITGEPK